MCLTILLISLKEYFKTANKEENEGEIKNIALIAFGFHRYFIFQTDFILTIMTMKVFAVS